MSVAAVMLVKDEIDVIGYTIHHLLHQVDHVYVADNGSTDGTLEILRELHDQFDEVDVATDDEVGYYQARKTTELAMHALEQGHDWVIPNDADEWWYSPDQRSLKAWLSALAGDVMIVRALLFDHVPTADDPPAECVNCGSTGVATLGAEPPLTRATCLICDGKVTPSPFKRIGWRKVHHGALPKVACRLRPDLEILPGNHAATTRGTGVTTSGLHLRHFTWRSEDQYVKKITNGARAYAATDLPEDLGAHWRMHGDPDAPDFDERVRGHFRQWFYSADPASDDTLVYDPAPHD